jgi:ribosomal protein S18 acetylase RimI-like enzyme
VADDLTVRPLAHDQWPDAMSLAARSFVGEPFMIEMFGAEPVRRLALADRFYRATPWRADEHQLAAFVNDLLVGFCLCSPPGRCQVCLGTNPDRPPDDPLQLVEWQFEVNVQAAHADQDTHAWISRVAVDPAVHGAGIGRTLMAQAMAALCAEDAAAVLLECQSHRENFYVACGFHRVRTFPDPAGPDAILMRADLRPQRSTG